MPTRRQLIGAGAASVALTAAAAYPLHAKAQDGDDDRSDVTPVVGTPMLQPAIELARAQEIALEENAGAAVTKIELDGDHGVLEYSIHLNNGVEVGIDATTGAIIKTEHSDDDDHDASSGTGTSGSSGSGDDGDHDDDD
jgi:uncharacterized membrane protein YkoI